MLVDELWESLGDYASLTRRMEVVLAACGCYKDSGKAKERPRKTHEQFVLGSSSERLTTQSFDVTLWG